MTVGDVKLEVPGTDQAGLLADDRHGGHRSSVCLLDLGSRDHDRRGDRCWSPGLLGILDGPGCCWDPDPFDDCLGLASRPAPAWMTDAVRGSDPVASKACGAVAVVAVGAAAVAVAEAVAASGATVDHLQS